MDNITKIRQAKEVLSTVMSEYFDDEPTPDKWVFIKSRFQSIRDLLEVTCQLLAEGLKEE